MTAKKMPIFIPLQKALEIHERQVRLYGGDAAVRDMGLLESALSVPASGFGGEYFHAFPFGMAAAYLFHIVKDHPFVDGNKRTGAVTALAFLAVNGYCLEADESDLECTVLSVAAGGTQKAEVARFFAKYCQNR